MTAIQPLLVALLLVTFAVYLRRLRSRLLDRLVVTAFITVAIAMVLRPEMSNQLAHRFGVGRGVDLLIYVSIVGLGFGGVLLFARLQAMQQQMVRLVRQLALESAQPPARGAEASSAPAPPQRGGAAAADP